MNKIRNPRNSLIAMGLLALAGCTNYQGPRDVIVPEGPFKGTYVVDTSSRPHTVKFPAPLTRLPSLGIITLYDYNLDGKPDRSLYSIYELKENEPNKGSTIRVDLPDEKPHADEIEAYKIVMKFAN